MTNQYVRLQLVPLESRETPSVGNLASSVRSGDSIAVQTRTGYFFNTYASIGQVSAIPNASFNTANSDEVVAINEIGGDGVIQSGDKVVLKTRTGSFYNSRGSIGPVSAIPRASFNPQISDEVFTIVKLQASSDLTVYDHDKFLIRTRTGYYLNSVGSVGPVSAIPQASFDPAASDEIFSVTIVQAAAPKTNIQIRGIRFIQANPFAPITSVVINLAVYERLPSGANGNPVSNALVNAGIADRFGLGSGIGRTDASGLAQIVFSPSPLYSGRTVKVFVYSLFEAPGGITSIDGKYEEFRTT